MDVITAAIAWAGSFASGVAGAYIFARLRKSAEISAMQANIEHIVDQTAKKSYAGAYAQEEAKNKATQEQLRLVVSNLEAVTTTTEQIKAQVGNATWLEQTIRTERSGAYRQLLVEVFHTWFGADLLAEMLTRSSDEAEIQQQYAKYDQHAKELIHQCLTTGLIAGPSLQQELLKLLDILTKEVRKDIAAWRTFARDLREAQKLVSFEARKELGYVKSAPND